MNRRTLLRAILAIPAAALGMKPDRVGLTGITYGANEWPSGEGSPEYDSLETMLLRSRPRFIRGTDDQRTRQRLMLAQLKQEGRIRF